MLERFVRSIIEKEGKRSVVDIPVDDISVNPYQPRRNFEQKKLDELAQSIKEQGVIQPVIVRRFGNGYELVAGERRLRASKLVGLKTIPAIVRQLDDQDMIEIAFIENLQREQLDEVETADAYNRLITERRDSVESVAERIGKDVDAIKARLWMLQLPQVVKKAVVSKLISLDHARAIALLANEKKQIEMLERIYREKLTVEQAREQVGLMPEYMKVRPKEIEKQESVKHFRYLPENLGQAEACLDLVRGLVQALRDAGVRVGVSELLSGSALNIKLSFPLEREECRPEKPIPKENE